MKAAIVKAKGSLEVDEFPVPEPAPGQILVKVGHVAVCGSDIHRLFSGNVSPGVVLGHEFSGTVATVGDNVSRWKMGDRVVGGGGKPSADSRDGGDPPPADPVLIAPAARQVVPDWDPRYTPHMLGHQGFPGTVEQGAFAQYTLRWDWQPLPVPTAWMTSQPRSPNPSPSLSTLSAARTSFSGRRWR